MSCVNVKIPARAMTEYPIEMGEGLVNNITRWLPATYRKLAIITDSNVKKYYGNVLLNDIKKRDVDAMMVSIPSGERSKNHRNKIRCEAALLKAQCGRDTVILALGGGVVGDMAGFVAATYMRGIPYIQIPTTLLAMVDSSVGGKTGIDTPQGKNLIGAFWQPKAVIIDINHLKTLPKKQFINGLIEALKMFLTHDKKHFNFAKKNIETIMALHPSHVKKIIKAAVTIKARVVNQDEKETNERMILNFGHTIGHALELASNYQLMHGYAVALGILVEAKISQLLGILDEKDFLTIETFFKVLNITGKALKKYSISSIFKAIKMDKKRNKDGVRYILLKKIGEIHRNKQEVAHRVPDDIVKRAWLDVSGA